MTTTLPVRLSVREHLHPRAATVSTSWFPRFALAALLTLSLACEDEAGPDRDVAEVTVADGVDDGTGDSDEDVADVAADGDADPTDGDAGAESIACGAEQSCGPNEVCVIECLCCGIDTGNPDDARSEYRCVSPPADCTDTPMACVERAEGCYAWGDRTCQIPCA